MYYKALYSKYMYVVWRLCWGRAALIVGQSYYESISLPIINYQQRYKQQAHVFTSG